MNKITRAVLASILTSCLCRAAAADTQRFEGSYRTRDGATYKVVVDVPQTPVNDAVPLEVVPGHDAAHTYSQCDNPVEVGWGDGPVMGCEGPSHDVKVPEYNTCAHKFAADFGAARVRVFSGRELYRETVLPVKFEVYYGYEGHAGPLACRPTIALPLRVQDPVTRVGDIAQNRDGSRGLLVLDVTFVLDGLDGRLAPAGNGRVSLGKGPIRIQSFNWDAEGTLNASAAKAASYSSFTDSGALTLRPAP